MDTVKAIANLWPLALVLTSAFLGGCPRIMTADRWSLGKVGRFCSKSATDCVEAARDRLSEGLDLSKNAISSLAQPLLVGLGRLLRTPIAPNLEQIMG